MKVLLALFVTSIAQLSYAQLLPQPETGNDTVGYKTVDEALADLRVKPGIELTDRQGWTIATDREAKTIWSFTPRGHPAFPAVVKRTVTEHDGSVFIRMGILCQSDKLACDQLVVEFNQMNERMRASMAKKPN